MSSLDSTFSYTSQKLFYSFNSESSSQSQHTNNQGDYADSNVNKVLFLIQSNFYLC
ncbi:hypothetical protein TTHERM_000716348 (macronuclear) [Tetrahymena thermophila SB210]|uniref:Uncharacterized protein n=1 Tax=Tetrahymena thermophila (strain SB210) TaxID=312017 RepID=W7X309_TETTS|nr:hypothetical protein TTHERM_000716348 [Tetrahymena thermophila SB210]EWS71827.1 hypothetical protein TTHERM_000716348 [Tetrahymena thermophila SB210]|eukprot:XP_012655649.1 hypothetical protein TTHERM_000716348 [Tetrahymena thermophila SB210]